MKESSVYGKFLQNNLVFLLVPTLIGAACGLGYVYSTPAVYQTTAALEVNYNTLNMSERMALTDESVSLTREAILHNQINLIGNSEIVKKGPLVVDISVIGVSKKQVSSDLDHVLQFYTQKYDTSQIGKSRLDVKMKNFPFYIFLGSALGFSAGLLYSLLKLYLESY